MSRQDARDRFAQAVAEEREREREWRAAIKADPVRAFLDERERQHPDVRVARLAASLILEMRVHGRWHGLRPSEVTSEVYAWLYREEQERTRALAEERDDLSGYLAEREAELEILQAPAMTKAEAAKRATGVLRNRTLRRAERAAGLRAEGKTRRQIGEVIAREEGQPAPFPVATVRDWLRVANRAKPTR